jgi:hypothetical protein
MAIVLLLFVRVVTLLQMQIAHLEVAEAEKKNNSMMKRKFAQ